MPRITQKFITQEVVHPKSGQVIFRDDELIGFGLRVTSSCISYIVERRVNGRVKRFTVGKHGQWNPNSAREEARQILQMMASGIPPVRNKPRAIRTIPSLVEAFAEYLKARTLRHNTLLSFDRIMSQSFADWLDCPVTDITKDMVEERFNELSNGSKKGTSGRANANLSMCVLRAVLNYASLKYEINGDPLIAVNPVSRITQLRRWHKLPQRRGIIPDYKLAAWYKAVMSMKRQTTKDYYLILILTGLRRNEAARLCWSDVDFDAKILTVIAEHSKGGVEHQLPLSDWIEKILRRRYLERKISDYVFPGFGDRGRYYCSYHTLKQLREQADCNFLIHDIRRSYLTMAEKLDVPYYALKKLAGHSMREDITAGYLVIDVERLREPMQKITDRLRELMIGGRQEIASIETATSVK